MSSAVHLYCSVHFLFRSFRSNLNYAFETLQNTGKNLVTNVHFWIKNVHFYFSYPEQTRMEDGEVN